MKGTAKFVADLTRYAVASPAAWLTASVVKVVSFSDSLGLSGA